MSLDHAIEGAWIAGERLDLRPLTDDDAVLIARHAGDIRVARMTTSIAHPLPDGSAATLISRAKAADRTEEVWALDARRSDGEALIGLVSLERMCRNQSEISFWVAPSAWNSGLASEAVRLLVEANPLGNCTIFASVFQDNPASARVLHNAGFEYIGPAEAQCIARDAVVPTWTYLKRYKP